MVFGGASGIGGGLLGHGFGIGSQQIHRLVKQRPLEDAAKVKVVDRTAVILDIFAQHATSREGKAHFTFKD